MTHAEAIKILTRYHDAAWETMHVAETKPRARKRAAQGVEALALAIRALERDPYRPTRAQETYLLCGDCGRHVWRCPMDGICDDALNR
jgi:hypothetical protein